MKVIKIIIILIFFCLNHSFSQINIDSLKSELKNFEQIKYPQSEFYDFYIIKYIDIDSLILFEVKHSIDGEIAEYLYGPSIISYKYDNKKRCIEKQKFDKYGQLKNFESPPMVVFGYDENNNITKIDYFNKYKQRVGRSEFVFDTNGNEIEYKILDKNLKIEKIIRTEYKDNGRIKITKYYDENDNLINK